MAMEKRSTPTAQSLIFFAFTIISLISCQTLVAMPSDPTRLVINLIHRDSDHSPYHIKNESSTARTQRIMATTSIYSQELEKLRRYLPTGGLQVDLYPNDGLFLVNFSIGQPPVPQLAIMDTGSSLLWVQCRPCLRCYHQYTPIFDSDKSSTFIRLPCNSEYCIFPQPKDTSCTSSDPCTYHQTYAKAVDSLGVLAKEQLLFHTSEHSSVVVQDVIFGCGDMNGDTRLASRLMSGVFGLGFKKVSLSTRFSKFSYCIGSVLDVNYMHNKLVFGTEAWSGGDSTPLQVINGNYHVVLEGINLGDKSLPIDPNLFRSNGDNNTGVIIDSGAVVTYLIKEGYDAVLKEVQNLLDPRLTQTEREGFLCYRGAINQDLVGFPAVTFRFGGGAELVLETQSLFYPPNPNEFCLAMQPSHALERLGNQSIIGVFAQQNYNVAYDMFGMAISFQKIDCELL